MKTVIEPTRPLPPHLAGNEATGIQTGEPVAQYELGPYRNFVYLAIDWFERSALWIDPSEEIDGVLHDLQSHRIELKGIVLTHSHHDHISGVPGLLLLFPQLPLYVHPADAHRLGENLRSNLKEVQDGDLISISGNGADSLALQVIHAPGHSAGELCLSFTAEKERYLFTGDTLFIRDCGRTDLPTGNDAEMFATLQRLKKLPIETIILPGHHYTHECASRLESELQLSPPLLSKTIEELAAL